MEWTVIILLAFDSLIGDGIFKLEFMAFQKLVIIFVDFKKKKTKIDMKK